MFESDWQKNGTLWLFVGFLPVAGFFATCVIYLVCTNVCLKAPEVPPLINPNELGSLFETANRRPKVPAYGMPSQIQRLPSAMRQPSQNNFLPVMSRASVGSNFDLG